MLGTFWEHLETKTASQISEKRFSVPPTGFVIYGINRDGAAPYGMIYDVGLLPRHRSRGTGSLLVRTALDALREKGVADCYLESGVDNPSAHRFFEKFGFGQVSCIFRAKL